MYPQKIANELKKRRFVLLCESGYAALNGLTCMIVPELRDAIVFDGRDNEEMKRKYYSAVLKTPFIVEALPQ